MKIYHACLFFFTCGCKYSNWYQWIINSLIINWLIQIFWKAKTFFKKLEYHFLVETTKIENTSFPFKTALSKANVKTNRMVTKKWPYHKEWSFASNCFIIVCTPPLSAGVVVGGGWTSYQIFKKGGFDRTSTLRGGCWKRRGNFFQGGCNFTKEIN